MTETTAKAELLATRKTADGKVVGLWSDGCVTTGYLHTCVRGAGVAKTPEGVAANVAAGWLLMGEVCVYDAAELPAAVKAARKSVHAADPIPAFRAAMNPAVKSAKPHAAACKCPRCAVAHVRNGCRRINCPVCG